MQTFEENWCCWIIWHAATPQNCNTDRNIIKFLIVWLVTESLKLLQTMKWNKTWGFCHIWHETKGQQCNNSRKIIQFFAWARFQNYMPEYFRSLAFTFWSNFARAALAWARLKKYKQFNRKLGYFSQKYKAKNSSQTKYSTSLLPRPRADPPYTCLPRFQYSGHCNKSGGELSQKHLHRIADWILKSILSRACHVSQHVSPPWLKLHWVDIRLHA